MSSTSNQIGATTAADRPGRPLERRSPVACDRSLAAVRGVCVMVGQAFSLNQVSDRDTTVGQSHRAQVARHAPA